MLFMNMNLPANALLIPEVNTFGTSMGDRLLASQF